MATNRGVSQSGVTIAAGSVRIEGTLTLPENTRGIVLFSHGSGSSRFSSRNNYVARHLEEDNLGTFLFDLLTPEEDAVYQNRFNIELLTGRLITVTQWIERQPETRSLSIGYFGASTGAAAALKAAARLGDQVQAVVSRGGRPDLALPEADRVEAPVLLLVGSLDVPVIELNEQAFRYLRCDKEIVVIPGASHLFEEPGKLEEVSRHASGWFQRHL